MSVDRLNAHAAIEPPRNEPLTRRASAWHGWLQALAVVALCTGVSAAMASHFDLADLIMVYLAGVVYVALRSGPWTSVAAVMASIFLFDLIFVPPRWSLNPTNPQHFVTFAVMLVVGLLISRLAVRARQQALVADARARRSQALNELARQLAMARSEDAIAEGLSAAVRSSFALPCVLLLPDAQGRLPDPPAQPDLAASMTIPLRGADAALGVLALQPRAPGLAPEELQLLNAFANQAALALERTLFERKSAAAVVEAETQRLRSTLLSGISHDFRTPLTTIVGAATSLQQQDKVLDAPRRALLTRSILDEALRLHALVSDMLDLTRMEEGAVQPSCEWCPADELVEEARDAVAPRLASHRLRTQVPPEAVVWCDPRLLEQALVNLLDNALRYTPPGSTIDVRVALDGERWSLVVADDGPGLPDGHERDVFKKFFRGRDEPAGAGTGLGLAICEAVARLHQGTITAVNDGGARFTLTLPQPANPTPPMEEIA